MDNIEKRIDKLEHDVTSIRVKLENGFTDNLNRVVGDVEEITHIVRRLEKSNDPAIRLAHCPYKLMVEAKYGKRTKILLAVYAIIVAAAAGAPAWVNLLFGIGG